MLEDFRYSLSVHYCSHHHHQHHHHIVIVLLSSPFVKLRKRPLISSCPSVRLSVCLSFRQHRTTWFPLEGFLLNFIPKHFLKTCQKIQASLKSNKNKGYFT
jgi:hypothetical protein